ncbi:MAG: hypothetical protein IKT58_07275 [Oscillospiraceae bacterium]|nr:hypothetical protein [Oscillospiraceae bacterium]
MPRYEFAEFIVDIRNVYSEIEERCADYLYTGDRPTDYTIAVTPEELKQEQATVEHICAPGYLEFICAYRKLCNLIPLRYAMILHASTITWKDYGIGFFARSGVGKTTHTRHWLKTLYPHAKIVNGDKPLVRFFEGKPYIYGTPWAGKENAQRNVKAPLTHLCLIERGEKNEVSPLPPQEALELLMVQILLPPDPQALNNTLDMLEQLLSNCQLWRIRCTPVEESALLARMTMFGE